jgi:hypothetical protein
MALQLNQQRRKCGFETDYNLLPRIEVFSRRILPEMLGKERPPTYGYLKKFRVRPTAALRKIFRRAAYLDHMSARNFLRNAAVGMTWFKQASREADARKSGFLEVPISFCIFQSTVIIIL